MRSHSNSGQRQQNSGARPRNLRTRSSDGDSSSDSSGGVPASDDRRTVSRVLHTPEAECNALPFELGTRAIYRLRCLALQLVTLLI